MKLIKALYWYYFEYRPELKDSYTNSQVEKMGLLIILALLVLPYFFIDGLINHNVKQAWGFGLGLLLVLLPGFIFSMVLLGKYDEQIKTKNN